MTNRDNQTVVKRLIILSKESVKVKLVTGELLKTIELLNMLNVRLSKKEALKELLEELYTRQKEIQMIAKYNLTPLLRGIDFGFEDLWTFSTEELKSGFAIMKGGGKKYIFPLASLPEKGILEGQLIEFEKVRDCLTEFPSVLGSLDGCLNIVLRRHHSSIGLKTKSNEKTNL